MMPATRLMFAEQSVNEAATLLRRGRACLAESGADAAVGFVADFDSQVVALEGLGARLRAVHARPIPMQ